MPCRSVRGRPAGGCVHQRHVIGALRHRARHCCARMRVRVGRSGEPHRTHSTARRRRSEAGPRRSGRARAGRPAHHGAHTAGEDGRRGGRGCVHSEGGWGPGWVLNGVMLECASCVTLTAVAHFSRHRPIQTSSRCVVLAELCALARLERGRTAEPEPHGSALDCAAPIGVFWLHFGAAFVEIESDLSVHCSQALGSASQRA